ncbi:hypothetical protein D3C84_992830 [compost metagenome]
MGRILNFKTSCVKKLHIKCVMDAAQANVLSIAIDSGFPRLGVIKVGNPVIKSARYASQ